MGYCVNNSFYVLLVQVCIVKKKILFYISLPIFLYALLLTQSRSGIVGLAVVIAGIIWKSKNKVLWIALVVIAAAVLFSRLEPLSQDRYLSIYRNDVRGAHSARGRISGGVSGLRTALRKPIVGYGLGTSLEINYNLSGATHVTHNLFIEVIQELGILGFVIFMMYLKSIIKSFFIVKRKILENPVNTNLFLSEMINAMQVWVLLALIFSMASYGLSEYTWYFFGGISVVLLRLSETNETNGGED